MGEPCSPIFTSQCDFPNVFHNLSNVFIIENLIVAIKKTKQPFML